MKSGIFPDGKGNLRQAIFSSEVYFCFKKESIRGAMKLYYVGEGMVYARGRKKDGDRRKN